MQDPQPFEAARPRLIGVAYRMLGSIAEAEDIVQEAWLRWHCADQVVRPLPWLTTVVVRLALDRLKSAQARRETYVGPWLPEPWVGHAPPAEPELASSLSFAFLRLLETLTPAQRAAFLLRDVFDHDYSDIAEMLGTTPANARQQVARARKHLGQAPRYTPEPEAVERLHAAFATAVREDDLTRLAALLVEDAVAWSDGGGKVNAARVPIHGALRIARAFAGFARLLPDDASFEVTWVNGLPGLVTRVGGQPYAVHAYEPSADGGIRALYAVLAPDKLGRVPCA